MKVRELIDELSLFDDEQEVHFAYNYGDYWHTQVAPEVSSVEEGFVKWSEYHSMPKVLDEDVASVVSHETVVILS